MKIKEKIDRGTSYFSSKEDYLDTERFYFLSCMQIFPLLDRFGRIMLDMANFLMYNTYKYKEPHYRSENRTSKKQSHTAFFT